MTELTCAVDHVRVGSGARARRAAGRVLHGGARFRRAALQVRACERAYVCVFARVCRLFVVAVRTWWSMAVGRRRRSSRNDGRRARPSKALCLLRRPVLVAAFCAAWPVLSSLVFRHGVRLRASRRPRFQSRLHHGVPLIASAVLPQDAEALASGAHANRGHRDPMQAQDLPSLRVFVCVFVCLRVCVCLSRRCGRPRLRATALMPPPVRRAAYRRVSCTSRWWGALRK
jgi:hypothetical protein